MKDQRIKGTKDDSDLRNGGDGDKNWSGLSGVLGRLSRVLSGSGNVLGGSSSVPDGATPGNAEHGVGEAELWKPIQVCLIFKPRFETPAG